MHGSDDYEFVIVGDMGIVSSYRPITHKGDHQTIVFVSKEFLIPYTVKYYDIKNICICE